ncbi:hypothetical protein RMQ97_15425, partial [Maricaulis sp. D1M11]|uniref:hypothetical protein n=1 Tax=Maricaulis sp. D1M11 TaxID=3076117 RepID=UPI0039B5C02E
TTQYTYDALGRVTEITNAEGFVETLTYNGFGELETRTSPLNGVTSYTYDALGRLETETLPATTSNGQPVVNRYVYDERGNQTQIILADGAPEQRITTFEYDAADRLTKTILPASSVYDSVTGLTDVSSAVEERVYDQAGNVIEIIDAAGLSTHMWYDGSGRLVASVDPLGKWVEHSYYNDGSVESTTVFDTAIALPVDRALGLDALRPSGSTRTAQFEYDGLGRITRTTRDGLVSQTLYDDVNRTITHIDPRGHQIVETLDKRGAVISRLNAELNETTFEYNAFGLVWKTTDALGHSSYTYYDELGRAEATIDAEGYLTRTEYDGVGNILNIVRYQDPYSLTDRAALTADQLAPTRTVSAADDAVTHFVYDTAGRLTTTTDAEGHSETYGLNAFGEQIEVTNKAGGITLNTYNARGQIISTTAPVTTAEGELIITRYEYDLRGNLTRETEAFGLSEQRQTTFEYDAGNRMVRKLGDAVDAYTSATSGPVSTRPEETYAYDIHGNLIEQVDAAGRRSLFWFDVHDRQTHAMVQTTGTGEGWLSHTVFDANGNVERSFLYNQATIALPTDHASGPATPAQGAEYSETSFVYDKNNRVLSQTLHNVETGALSGGSYTLGFADAVSTYTYDAVGNVTQMVDANGNTTRTAYDGLGRRTVQVDAAHYWTDWSYDENGNVTEERRYGTALTPTASFPDERPAISSLDRQTLFTYDHLGQRLTSSRLSVRTAHADIYIGMPDQGDRYDNVTSTVTYTYNALGQVKTKTEATGDTKTYFYDAGGRLTQERRQGYTDHTGAFVTPRVTYEYDGLGNLTMLRQVGAGNGDQRITRHVYGAGGRLQQTTTGLTDLVDTTGVDRTFRYDVSGRLVREEYSRTTHDWTQFGVPLTTVDEAIGYAYDVSGNLVRQEFLEL